MTRGPDREDSLKQLVFCSRSNAPKPSSLTTRTHTLVLVYFKFEDTAPYEMMKENLLPNPCVSSCVPFPCLFLCPGCVLARLERVL